VSTGAAVAIGFRGGVKLGGIVSQGCRPIGEPLTITKADSNFIHQLASRSAYDQLQAAFHSLTEVQRERAQGNILVGLAMTEYVEDFHTGDFLVRTILGGDPANGILAVGAMPRVGQTLQFQLRDREAAHEELRDMLARLEEDLGRAPCGTLLFACAGRGKHLFGAPHHDAAQMEDAFGPVPLAGFFCNGEIGSVGSKAYLHGFTASGVAFVEA
jgi:small ligand-binding sensory domain FIST